MACLLRSAGHMSEASISESSLNQGARGAPKPPRALLVRQRNVGHCHWLHVMVSSELLCLFIPSLLQAT